MPTPSATQKPTNPTLPAAPPPAEQAAQAPQTQQAPAPAQKQAPAQTGYATKDVFQAPVKQPVALQTPAAVQGEMAAQTPATDERMKAAMGQLLEDPKFAESVRNETLFKDADAMGKLEEVAQKAAPQADPNKQPNPTAPTEGMTEDERAKYDGLPPDQKKRYDELHQQACATPPPEKSVQALRDLLKNGELGQYLDVENSPNTTPEGKADLQSLLFSGKLEQRSSYDGRTTLSYLHDLATGPGDKTGKGVNRRDLLAGLLKDLARPDTMNQGQDNRDCAGTDAAYGMAKGDPAEYARVITTLAEKGEVNLTSPWAKFFGKPDAILKFDGTVDDPSKRPLTQSIFARSFVQAATDRANAGVNPIIAVFNQLMANLVGLNGKEFVGQLNAGDGINGGGWKPAYMPKAEDPQRAQAEQDAQKLLGGASDDKPVYALVNGHWVSVTGAGGDPATVTYQDSQGHKQTVPMADFLAALNTVCYQGGDVPPSMGDSKNAGRGGGGDPTLGTGPGSKGNK